MNKYNYTNAAKFAAGKHLGQKDDLGLDYFTSHICQVFRIIAHVSNDEDVICAAFLHDTIEDTNTTYEELIENFSVRVADLVMEVTHEGKADSKGFYFPRLKTKEGILIKFADRLSNLSRMGAWDAKRQQQYLRKSKFWNS